MTFYGLKPLVLTTGEAMKHLLPFATPRQAEVIETVIRLGSHQKAAKELGINRSNVSRAVQAVKSKAAKQGIAPEADMVHQAAEGFTVKELLPYIKTAKLSFNGLRPAKKSNP